MTSGLGVVAVGVATSLPASTSAAHVARHGQARLRLSLVASGLASPTFAGAPRGQAGYLYVTEQPV